MTSADQKAAIEEPPASVIFDYHSAAAGGDKRRVKRCLKTGLDVDAVDKQGRTALFTACLEGHENVVEHLLKHGADVNQRIPEGSTPLHAASYGSNVRVLRRLVDLGGDLRLHDVNGLVVRNWAMRQRNVSRRNKNVAFLWETQNRALACSDRPTIDRSTTKNGSSASKKDERVKKDRCVLNDFSAVNSFGYGLMFTNRYDRRLETSGGVQLIRENALKHDEVGPTYNNGPYMVMESMTWEKMNVTAKRLHREPVRGAYVDLLINESEFATRLRHPNLLLLMALCQTRNLENVVLLYERVSMGSLFTYIHTQGERLNDVDVCGVFHQISSALLYVHHQGVIHCALSSHAIQLSSELGAKLSNFEYASRQNTPVGPVEPGMHMAPKSAVLLENHLKVVYNWAAPEVLAGKPFTVSSDLYSLCAVLWEVTNGSLPWLGLDLPAVRKEFSSQKQGLALKEGRHPFDKLLQSGLVIDPQSRRLSVMQFQESLKMTLATGRLGLSSDPRVGGRSMTTPRRNVKDNLASAGLPATERGRTRKRAQRQMHLEMDQSTDDTVTSDHGLVEHKPAKTHMSAPLVASEDLKKRSSVVVFEDDPACCDADVGDEAAALPKPDGQSSATLVKQRSSSLSNNRVKVQERRRGCGDSLDESSCDSLVIPSRAQMAAALRQMTSDIEDTAAQSADLVDQLSATFLKNYATKTEHTSKKRLDSILDDSVMVVASNINTSRKDSSGFHRKTTAQSTAQAFGTSQAKSDAVMSMIADKPDSAPISNKSSSADPFGANEPDTEMVETYRALAIKPLPRLPRLYTLPPRKNVDEPANQAPVSSTMPPCSLTAEFTDVVASESSLKQVKATRYAPTYAPTNGVSLNELKAAVAPRASALNCIQSDDSPDRHTNQSEVPSKYPASDAHLIQVQPASHHRPSIIADHSSKAAMLAVLSPPAAVTSQHNQKPAQPLQDRVIPALESLSLVHPTVARVESTAGSASNPLVGAPPAPSKAPIVARVVKHAATMPVPAAADADKMQKFRSDPVLKHEVDAKVTGVPRSVPPSFTPVGDFRAAQDSLNQIELNEDYKLRSIHELISQFQDYHGETIKKNATFTCNRSPVNMTPDLMCEGESSDVCSQSQQPLTSEPAIIHVTPEPQLQHVQRHTEDPVPNPAVHSEDNWIQARGNVLVTIDNSSLPSETMSKDGWFYENSIGFLANKNVVDDGLQYSQTEGLEHHSRHSVAVRCRSETDEETASMVSRALERAKDEIGKRFSTPMKTVQKVMAEGFFQNQDEYQLNVSNIDSSVTSSWKRAPDHLELGHMELLNTHQDFILTSHPDNTKRTNNEPNDGPKMESSLQTGHVSSKPASDRLLELQGRKVDGDRLCSLSEASESAIEKKSLLSWDETTTSSDSEIYQDEQFSPSQMHAKELHQRMESSTLGPEDLRTPGQFYSPLDPTGRRGSRARNAGNTCPSAGMTFVRQQVPQDFTPAASHRSLNQSQVSNGESRMRSTIVIETDEHGNHKISIRKTPVQLSTPYSASTRIVLDHNTVIEQED